MKNRLNINPSEKYMEWLIKKDKISMVVSGVLFGVVMLFLYLTYLSIKICFGV